MNALPRGRESKDDCRKQNYGGKLEYRTYGMKLVNMRKQSLAQTHYIYARRLRFVLSCDS